MNDFEKELTDEMAKEIQKEIDLEVIKDINLGAGVVIGWYRVVSNEHTLVLSAEGLEIPDTECAYVHTRIVDHNNWPFEYLIDTENSSNDLYRWDSAASHDCYTKHFKDNKQYYYIMRKQ